MRSVAFPLMTSFCTRFIQLSKPLWIDIYLRHSRAKLGAW
jgi:hypothetical protein